MEQAPVTRTCIKCGETKAFELFEKDKNKKFGRRHSCNKCANKKTRSVKTWEQREKLIIKYSLEHGGVPSTKICTKCKEVKPLELFNKTLISKFGRKSRCRKCDLEQSRQYYIKNPKPKKPKEPKQFGEAPLTKICIKCNTEKEFNQFVLSKNCIHGRQNICTSCYKLSKALYRKRPEVRLKKLERSKIYYQKYKEVINEKNRAIKKKSYHNNPEKYREKQRINNIKNKEKINKRNREFWKKEVETLGETYLKSLIRLKFNIPKSQVTDEQLQLPKESILLHRQYEELKLFFQEPEVQEELQKEKEEVKLLLEQAPLTKICKNCGETKELELFVRSKSSKFGRANWCKKCQAKRCKERYYRLLNKPKKSINN